MPALVAQVTLVSCYLHQQEPSIDALQCLTCLCRCKPGFYNLGEVNPEGCQACFCFGHSLACSSSSHHVVTNITSDFMEGITQQVSSLSVATLLSSRHMLCIITMFKTRKICCFLRHSPNQNKSMKNWQLKIYFSMSKIILTNSCSYLSVLHFLFFVASRCVLVAIVGL